MNRGLAVMLLIVMGNSILVGCNQVSADAAPDFEFTGFDGKASSLHQSFGKPLVVNFWAVWCGPCREEFPAFQEVYAARNGQFRMISICVDDQSDPPGFVKAQGYTWEFGFDKGSSGSKTYQISGIPRTLFIDKRGKLVDDHVGSMSKEDFETKLAKILSS